MKRNMHQFSLLIYNSKDHNLQRRFLWSV